MTIAAMPRMAAALMGAGLLLAPPAMAQQLDGAALGDACTSCHGATGHSEGSIPALAGLDKATLLSALQDFKADKGNSTIMNRIVRGYTDAELEALADYFSSVKPQ